MHDLSSPLQESLKSTDPLVSAIVPSYNKGPYLAECVLSLLNQSYKNLELIIVNDGSNDQTSSVARQLISDYPNSRIRLIEKTNSGVSDARNQGLRAALGRLVFCIDGDDQAKPQYVESAVYALRNNNANFYFTDQENFGASTGVWVPQSYDPYYVRYDNPFPTPSIYDKTLFLNSGGYKVALGYAEDWEYWISLSRHGLKPIKGSEPQVRYRSNDSGIASTFIDGRWHDCVVMVVLSNQDLFAVDEVTEALNYYPHSAAVSLKRSRELEQIHQQEWLLKLLVGIQEAFAGNFKRAQDLVFKACELTLAKNWVAVYQLARLLDRPENSKSDLNEALQLYHTVRTLRPDMGPKLKQRIKDLNH